jgi:rhodanese-related sulfurtransferase
MAAFHHQDLAIEAGVTIRPIHTPGHTPEHLSYLVLLDGRPTALLSGGSLLVGSVGRTDLLGDWRARQLAIMQHRSVHRFAELPDDVGVFPTHGAGSFCAAGQASDTTSTLGEERRTNRVFMLSDSVSFAEEHLAGLQPHPAYYEYLAPINLRGPETLPDTSVADLRAEDMEQLEEGVHIVDGRPRTAFAQGHIPGALGVELEDLFGVWVGWLLPFDAPIALVLDPDQSVDEARVQLGRIGFEQLRGVLRAMDPWVASARRVNSFETVDLDRFVDAVRTGLARQVLDVRSPAEWEQAHLPGSIHAYVPDLANAIPAELDGREPIWIACASGFRSTIAASLLERAGFRPVVLNGAGVPDVLERLTPAPALDVPAHHAGPH